MWQLLHSPHLAHDIALGLPPVWVPATQHPGVAATVVAVASVALAAVTRLRQGRPRPGRPPHPPSAGPVDATWFTSHTLDGFPDDAVRIALEASDEISVDRLYAAWILALHGVSAAWLTKNLDLPADAVRLIIDAARTQAPKAPHDAETPRKFRD
ncbi:hypothetical protein [Streptomyces shenzhenensis]|uniref:hypothetical protein n=1 Tax=Streptomyces shenzhenensis TaxID=943815 RepID=UPI0036CEF6E5